MKVYVSVWQARDRVSVIAVNEQLDDAMSEAQKYGDNLNEQNPSFWLHRAVPDVKTHVAAWRDRGSSHQIFIAEKELG